MPDKTYTAKHYALRGDVEPYIHDPFTFADAEAILIELDAIGEHTPETLRADIEVGDAFLDPESNEIVEVTVSITITPV